VGGRPGPGASFPPTGDRDTAVVRKTSEASDLNFWRGVQGCVPGGWLEGLGEEGYRGEEECLGGGR
jgi:hypothetical protein